MAFHTASTHGFVRVAACSLPVTLGRPLDNARAIQEVLPGLAQRGVQLAVFPELCLTGYTLDDLFTHSHLLNEATLALHRLAAESSPNLPVIVVGAPMLHRGKLYNCAVTIGGGQILHVRPKVWIPGYNEFYETRYFTPAPPDTDEAIFLTGIPYPFSTRPLETELLPAGVVLGTEICEDMWASQDTAAASTALGATLIANLSSSPATIGRARDRRLMLKSASLRYQCAYIYAASGAGESTNDLAWDGDTVIVQQGDILAEGERFRLDGTCTVADIDLTAIAHERQVRQTFITAPQPPFPPVTDGFGYPLQIPAGELINPRIRRFPFVPNDPAERDSDCDEAFAIQVAGLVTRMKAIGTPKLVIGVSGGLDSTHALLVAARAMDTLGRDRCDIGAYTLPGFATSAGTKANAYALCDSLGIPCKEIDIRPAATQMLDDLDHPYSEGEAVYDVTFENVQAGLRTDYLFRIANHTGGLVVGTGDLSELALGWCTYGVGDHMSHYSVNCGVPKTLIQHLIRWVARKGGFGEDTSRVLRDILAQEISPELVPSDGKALQSTEQTIGPYELHDFFLYYTLRGYTPTTIAFLAWVRWKDADAGDWPEGIEARHAYTLEQIVEWLGVFLKRFHGSQFKRTCVPNGPKVSPAGSLSPRGDWRMPSDVSAAAALADLDNVWREY